MKELLVSTHETTKVAHRNIIYTLDPNIYSKLLQHAKGGPKNQSIYVVGLIVASIAFRSDSE